MAKSAMIRVRVAPRLRHEAEAVLERLGMTPTEAITLFYKQVSLHRGLPFPEPIPNAVTRGAIKAALRGEDVETFPSVAEWAKRVRAR